MLIGWDCVCIDTHLSEDRHSSYLKAVVCLLSALPKIKISSLA
jgi:hypothetical protein